MTKSGAPIEMVWDGATEVLRPINSTWARRASKEFVTGEVYRIVDEPERSTKTHNHYHASVHSAWENLPERLADQFPTADHLRKYALIKAGICDTLTMPCPTQAAALRFAAMARKLDEFALATAENSIVTIYTAKSQSYKSMGKADFRKSKDAVLEIIAGMIGVTAKELGQPTAAQYLATG